MAVTRVRISAPDMSIAATPSPENPLLNGETVTFVRPSADHNKPGGTLARQDYDNLAVAFNKIADGRGDTLSDTQHARVMDALAYAGALSLIPEGDVELIRETPHAEDHVSAPGQAVESYETFSLRFVPAKAELPVAA